MEDKDIENIVNKTLDERKKRNTSKIFHDPSKAETAFFYAFMGGLVLGVCLFVAMFHQDIAGTNDFTQKAIEELDCYSLKKLIIEPQIYFDYKNQLERLILAKCL